MSDTTYNKNLFTSECCNAFNIYEGNICKCSKCGKTICRIQDNESLTIGVKFSNSSTSNVSGDIISSFEAKVPRYAHDPTCELCNIKCPKCKCNTRYLRNPQGTLIFVCPKCRNYFKADE